MDKVFEESIILIGSAGAGKSLLSSQLAKQTGLPLINTDFLRHCPMDISQVEEDRKQCKQSIAEMEQYLANNSPSVLYNETKLTDLKKNLTFYDAIIDTRKLLPNVPNYKAMGFDKNISQELKRRFGDIAWHFYQKQFETKLLQAIVQQLRVPCIIEVGGGSAISLDKDYAILAQQFAKIDQALFEKLINWKYIGFDKIANCLRDFDHVVYLELPKDYKKTMEKAGTDPLNDLFLSTKQYEQLATHTLSVEGLIRGSMVDKTRLNEILDELIEMTELEDDIDD